VETVAVISREQPGKRQAEDILKMGEKDRKEGKRVEEGTGQDRGGGRNEVVDDQSRRSKVFLGDETRQRRRENKIQWTMKKRLEAWAEKRQAAVDTKKPRGGKKKPTRGLDASGWT